MPRRDKAHTCIPRYVGYRDTIRGISAQEHLKLIRSLSLSLPFGPWVFKSRLSEIDSRNLYGDLRVRSLRRSYRNCKLFTQSLNVPVDYPEGMRFRREGDQTSRFVFEIPLNTRLRISREFGKTWGNILEKAAFSEVSEFTSSRTNSGIRTFFCFDSTAKVWSRVIRCSFPVWNWLSSTVYLCCKRS